MTGRIIKLIRFVDAALGFLLFCLERSGHVVHGEEPSVPFFLFFYFDKCLPVLTKLQTGSQSPLLFLLGLFLPSERSSQQLLPGFITTKEETDWLSSP